MEIFGLPRVATSGIGGKENGAHILSLEIVSAHCLATKLLIGSLNVTLVAGTKTANSSTRADRGASRWPHEAIAPGDFLSAICGKLDAVTPRRRRLSRYDWSVLACRSPIHQPYDRV